MNVMLELNGTHLLTFAVHVGPADVHTLMVD